MGRGTVNASKVWKYGTSAVRMKSGRYENLQSSYMPGGAGNMFIHFIISFF